MELILGTVVSNCYIKYKEEFEYKGTIIDFRKDLIEEKIKNYFQEIGTIGINKQIIK